MSKITVFNVTNYDIWIPTSENKIRSDYPALLSNTLPSVMFAYTDICESHITSDIQTPLLRVSMNENM